MHLSEALLKLTARLVPGDTSLDEATSGPDSIGTAFLNTQQQCNLVKCQNASLTSFEKHNIVLFPLKKEHGITISKGFAIKTHRHSIQIYNS